MYVKRRGCKNGPFPKATRLEPTPFLPRFRCCDICTSVFWRYLPGKKDSLDGGALDSLWLGDLRYLSLLNQPCSDSDLRHCSGSNSLRYRPESNSLRHCPESNSLRRRSGSNSLRHRSGSNGLRHRLGSDGLRLRLWLDSLMFRLWLDGLGRSLLVSDLKVRSGMGGPRYRSESREPRKPPTAERAPGASRRPKQIIEN